MTQDSCPYVHLCFPHSFFATLYTSQLTPLWPIWPLFPLASVTQYLDPNVPIVWKHIQIHLPRCYSASSSRSHVHGVNTENVGDNKTVARLEDFLYLQLFTNCLEIMIINSVTEPCIIFKVMTCLQLNCGCRINSKHSFRNEFNFEFAVHYSLSFCT